MNAVKSFNKSNGASIIFSIQFNTPSNIPSVLNVITASFTVLNIPIIPSHIKDHLSITAPIAHDMPFIIFEAAPPSISILNRPNIQSATQPSNVIGNSKNP
jgi:hypothetical protein